MCNSSVNVFSAGCYNDRKKQLKQLFRNLPAQQQVYNADPKLGMGEVTMDEVHSLFLIAGSSSSHFSLDTGGSAQDTGFLLWKVAQPGSCSE